ncbi:unnamed protein product [Urochloa decumbens]|uniref:DUF1618 domain-containing protein n=1 Tax=Urochloa decumbens TaxID=240449 RepID=A0ABC9BGS5_9POAL
MSTSASAAMPTASSHLDCLLLNVHAYLGECKNATTASSTTRHDQNIEVSLRLARPPLPSDVFVHCPELGFTVLPRVVRAVEDLLLIRVDISCQPDYVSSPNDSDYFIYRAGCGGNKRGTPSLGRLFRPHPFFHDDDVGLLSRGDHYTVAALLASGTPDVYELHILHSQSPSEWIYRKVSVKDPQRAPPLVIPERCNRLLYHDTTTVIAIGGEGGTMGWVDLWRGILLCDVLRDEPTIRGVPLPFPLDLVGSNNGLGADPGCPQFLRGIAFIKRGANNAEDCLKLVHLEANATGLLPDALGSGSPSFLMHSWAILTYTNNKMTSSWKDWHRDGRVQASAITIDSQIKSELFQSGLLLEPSDVAGAGRGLQNLLVSNPAPDISAAHGDVVYLMAREKFMHPKAYVLAVDLKNKRLVSASEFGTEREPYAPVMHCPSTISKYMDLETSR